MSHDLPVFFRQFRGTVQDKDDYICGGQRLPAFFDADFFDGIFCFADTGGIEPDSGDIILSQMREQAQIAIDTADVIIFMESGTVVQMASPEEMLEHPANDLVRNFLGKHSPETPAPSKVESFMRTNVFSVHKDRGVLECAERMARGSVDTLLVTDEENRYVGTVSIGDIRHWGRELNSIEPLIRQTARTARVGDEAKESFDYLLDSGANYVVVLNADDTIAGIVTKTSVARSVAENLWGGQ